MIVAVLAEADAGRDGHLGFGQQQLGKFQRAQSLEPFWNLRPDEHRGHRFGHRPADPVQAGDQHVAPAAVVLDDLLDRLLRPVERLDRRDLDRLEDAVIQVTLQLRQRPHDLRIAHAKTHPPARHVVAFRQREKLHADLLRLRNLQQTWRLIAVKNQIGVGQIMHDHQLVLARKGHNLLEKTQIDHPRGRVVGKTENQHLGTRHRLLIGGPHVGQKVALLPQRYAAHLAAGDDHAVGMDRIGRIRRQHHIARADHCQRQMGQPFLGADRHDGFPFRVELDAIAPPVPVGNRHPQLGNPLGGRVTMVMRFARRLDHLFNDMRRRRLIGIAHPEVDNVFTAPARLLLHRRDNTEDIRRKALHPWKFRQHAEPLQEDVAEGRAS